MTTPVTYNSKTYTTYMTYNTIQKFTLLTIRYDHKFITTLVRIALTHWQYLFIQVERSTKYEILNRHNVPVSSQTSHFLIT